MPPFFLSKHFNNRVQLDYGQNRFKFAVFI